MHGQLFLASRMNFPRIGVRKEKEGKRTPKKIKKIENRDVVEMTDEIKPTKECVLVHVQAIHL